MKPNEKKIFLHSLVFLGLFLLATKFTNKVFAAVCSLDAINACGTNSSCLTSIQDQCNSDIDKTRSEALTLKNQIAQFNAQINLTTLKIADTESKIQLLGGRISQLEVSLNDLTTAFTSRAVETYKLSRFEDNFIFLLSATDVNDAVERFHYLQKIQDADQVLLQQLQEAQTTYQGQKQDQEALQKTLQVQQANLNSQKKAKANLLAVTQGSEANYQSLLSQAQAALAALSNYAESVGISLIPHQDLSDSWGKYYNQRDSNWGNNVINNSSCTDSKGKLVPCTIALVGCLITSYSMVVSHYGGSILPSDVAADSSDFLAGSAYFNSPGPSANGHSATDVANPTIQQLKDDLNSGKSVIAGLSINGGPYCTSGSNCHYSDHWVVLRSVDGDSFKINDPEYPGAMNVSLKDHYASWTIIQAKIYN